MVVRNVLTLRSKAFFASAFRKSVAQAAEPFAALIACSVLVDRFFSRFILIWLKSSKTIGTCSGCPCTIPKRVIHGSLYSQYLKTGLLV